MERQARDPTKTTTGKAMLAGADAAAAHEVLACVCLLVFLFTRVMGICGWKSMSDYGGNEKTEPGF